MVRIFAITVISLLIVLSGCAYFNTYYMAQKKFKDAERQYVRDGEVVENNTKNLYNDAITGAAGIIRDHADSRYVDDSLYIMGLSYYRIEDYRLALTKFDEILRAFPEDEFARDAQYYKARCLIEMDRYDEARVVLNDIVMNGNRAQKGRAGVALIEIAWRGEIWDELLTAAQSVIDSDPEEDDLYEAIVYKGEALYNLERYEECAAALEQLPEKKIEPELRLKGNLQLALAKAELGEYDEGLEYLNSMQSKGEFADYAPQIRLQMGKIYELQEDTEKAIETYRNLAGDFEDSLSAKEAWYRVGRILIQDLSNIDAAKEAFDNVRKNKAKSTEPWVSYSTMKSEQIDSLKAKLDAIEKLINIRTDQVDSGKNNEAAVTAAPDSASSDTPDSVEAAPDSAKSDTTPPDKADRSEKDKVKISAVEALPDSALTDTPDSVEAAQDSAKSDTTPPDKADRSEKDKVTISAVEAVPDSALTDTPDLVKADSDTTSSAITKAVSAAKDTTKTVVPAPENNTIDQAASIKAERENRAYLRFSLAELYTFSFDRPDSALTQYRLIIEETPETDYAVRSEYFLGLHELRSEGRYSEETDHALMQEIIVKYPDSKFAQLLKVSLGIIEKPPDVRVFTEAEQARISGRDADVYLPLFQKVVDSYPGTKSAYQAQFVIAYYTEHDVGSVEKALELYTEISKLDKNPYNRDYVALAEEKLKHVEDEPKLLKEIEKNIVYLTYGTGRTSSESSEETGQDVETSGQDEELTGFQKIRARNVRIRSRYYTD